MIVVISLLENVIDFVFLMSSKEEIKRASAIKSIIPIMKYSGLFRFRKAKVATTIDDRRIIAFVI